MLTSVLTAVPDTGVLAFVLAAAQDASGTALDIPQIGGYSAVIALLGWFAKAVINTVDRRLGEIVEKVGSLSQEHSTTIDRVCASFEQVNASATKRNDALADKLLALARERSLCAACGAASCEPTATAEGKPARR